MGHDDHLRVVEMPAYCPVDLVELPLVGQPHFDDLRAHAAYQVGPDRPARVAGRVHRGPRCDHDVLQAGLGDNSAIRRPMCGSAPLRENAIVKISQSRSKAGWGG